MKALLTKPSNDSPSRKNLPPLTPVLRYPITPIFDNVLSLQRKSACACGGSCPRCQSKLPIQTKLAMSQPGDIYEQEANRIAEWVVGGHASEVESPAVSRSNVPSGIQRISAIESPAQEDAVVIEEEQPIGGEPPPVQRLAAPRAMACEARMSVDWQDRLSASLSRGRPLDAGVRSCMEGRFGAHFDQVRVHTDSEAADISSSIAARAFTHGSHVYFGAGEYAIGTEQGRRVLAHELTHVIQQGGASPKGADAGILREPSMDGRAATVQRMAAFNPANRVRESVYPWGAGGPSGTDYTVRTDAGSSVSAWVAYSPWRIELHYWCHGHSLGTFNRFGYSVYSGGDMARVVADEWTPVAPASARAGDIAVFTNFEHSAKFVSPVVSGGVLDESASTLSTKNGQAAEKTDTLRGIRATYSMLPSYAVYRHR